MGRQQYNDGKGPASEELAGKPPSPDAIILFWIDTGLKLPPSIQIKRVRSKCDINAGEVLMSLFFFRFCRGQVRIRYRRSSCRNQRRVH